MKKIICKKCKKEMKYLGNITNIILASIPPQWDDVYVCDKCKIKKTIREQGVYTLKDYSYLDRYEEL